MQKIFINNGVKDILITRGTLLKCSPNLQKVYIPSSVKIIGEENLELTEKGTILSKKEKNIFKRFGMYLLNRKNRKKHEKAVKLIVSEEHTMEETIEYMKKRYKAFQAGVSYPHYEECRMNFQYSRIRRMRPELFCMEKIIQEPESFDDIGAVREWQRQIDEQDREWRKIAQSISNEEFPSDYHMFIIDKGEQGKMEIELDTYGQGISVSYSGDKKVMDAIVKDIYRFYGVSQADIEHKTDRYKALVAVLST